MVLPNSSFLTLKMRISFMVLPNSSLFNPKRETSKNSSPFGWMAIFLNVGIPGLLNIAKTAGKSSSYLLCCCDVRLKPVPGYYSGGHYTLLRGALYTSQGGTIHFSGGHYTLLRGALYTSQGGTIHFSGWHYTLPLLESRVGTVSPWATLSSVSIAPPWAVLGTR